MTEDYLDNDEEWISKTQRKRECDALQALGEQLITLKPDELRRFDLPDSLFDAIEAAHKINKHGALKRQKQYIGRLMRDVDADMVANQLADIRHKDDLHNAHFKRLEKWRDRIVEEGDQAINDLVNDYPEADRQHLRQLYRNIVTEQKKNKPPVSARQLFKYIRELAENS